MKREYISAAYIKVCMLWFLLFGFVDSISSSEFQTGEKRIEENLNYVVSDSIILDQQIDSLSVSTLEGCVNLYENQTVSSVVLVQGCNTLTVKNVIVSGNGDLTLSAPDAVLINGPFEVKIGGLLKIKNDLTQWSFDYIYDNAGNRIRRTASPMKLSSVN